VDVQVTGAELAFTVFALGTQAVLLGYFVARRWSPGLAARFGWAAYAIAGLGLPLGLWLLVGGASWRLFAGPLLMAGWALLGTYVDVLRPREWRRAPLVMGVLVPYVALYVAAQMCLWWPLVDIAPVAWWCFLVLFVPSTALNLWGHAVPGSNDHHGAPGFREAIGRVARGIVDLLPDAPSDDAPPPDIDGRRPMGIDPEALRRLERTRKDGRGGDR
jgi:hypothetical protein